MLVLTALAHLAHAARTPVDECLANLVVVGQVHSQSYFWLNPPGQLPQYPAGRRATRSTFSVLRTVFDATGDAADAIVEVATLGGRSGTIVTIVSEHPNFKVGDVWALALKRNVGAQDPLILNFSYIPPTGELPTQASLQQEWLEHCNAN